MKRIRRFHDMGESQAGAVIRSAENRLAELTEEEWHRPENIAEYGELKERIRKTERILEVRQRYREEDEKHRQGR